jgi:hypothetical protein
MSTLQGTLPCPALLYRAGQGRVQKSCPVIIYDSDIEIKRFFFLWKEFLIFNFSAAAADG